VLQIRVVSGYSCVICKHWCNLLKRDIIRIIGNGREQIYRPFLSTMIFTMRILCLQTEAFTVYMMIQQCFVFTPKTCKSLNFLVPSACLQQVVSNSAVSSFYHNFFALNLIVDWSVCCGTVTVVVMTRLLGPLFVHVFTKRLCAIATVGWSLSHFKQIYVTIFNTILMCSNVTPKIYPFVVSFLMTHSRW